MYISKIILSTKKKADGVVEILNTKGSEFSLFDENFLKEIADMKEKNFALELLKRLLEEHIKKHAKKRMVEAEKFSEMLDARLAEYLRGLISNEEVIKELLNIIISKPGIIIIFYSCNKMFGYNRVIIEAPEFITFVIIFSRS